MDVQKFLKNVPDSRAKVDLGSGLYKSWGLLIYVALEQATPTIAVYKLVSMGIIWSYTRTIMKVHLIIWH